MRKGDRVLFYHSVSDKAVVGIAKVFREAYPDSTATGGGLERGRSGAGESVAPAGDARGDQRQPAFEIDRASPSVAVIGPTTVARISLEILRHGAVSDGPDQRD